ncbi:MAG: hypothetical protein K9J51_10345, partial [Desulfotignum sp.]|nr:hypothetical protein [Desulfotignum sp.]
IKHCNKECFRSRKICYNKSLMINRVKKSEKQEIFTRPGTVHIGQRGYAVINMRCNIFTACPLPGFIW